MSTKKIQILNGASIIPKPDWNQTDNTKADYIKNKPFYEDTLVDITWDGDTTGKTSVANVFYHVSADTPSPEELFGATVSVYNNGKVGSMVILDGWIVSGENYAICSYVEDWFIVTYADNVTVNGQIFPAKGVYFPKVDSSKAWYVSAIRKTELKKLDRKFLDLPNASSDALGGIKADAVEETDTQPVRIGTDGKLYTAQGGSRDAVLYTAQSLTEAQKNQARANIGAGTPYTLPQASLDALGGVKADSVESTDTQPVRIGGDGKLYTAPGGSADISLGISGATAGQMAKIKTVDASGAPTAWEAGDAASGGTELYGKREPDYYYEVAEQISGLYISEINGNSFSANKLACLVEFPAGTGGFYYHALYTLQGSKDKNYCISNHNPPKLSNISTKDSVVFFIVEKLNNQNYKYNYIGQCKAREQSLDGSYGTYAAGIFPNSIEGETSIKSILLQGEKAFGVGVKISIWLD